MSVRFGRLGISLEALELDGDAGRRLGLRGERDALLGCAGALLLARCPRSRRSTSLGELLAVVLGRDVVQRAVAVSPDGELRDLADRAALVGDLDVWASASSRNSQPSCPHSVGVLAGAWPASGSSQYTSQPTRPSRVTDQRARQAHRAELLGDGSRRSRRSPDRSPSGRSTGRCRSRPNWCATSTMRRGGYALPVSVLHDGIRLPVRGVGHRRRVDHLLHARVVQDARVEASREV